jgi:hypothetical protein
MVANLRTVRGLYLRIELSYLNLFSKLQPITVDSLLNDPACKLLAKCEQF